MAKSCPQDLVRALVEGTLGSANDSSGVPLDSHALDSGDLGSGDLGSGDLGNVNTDLAQVEKHLASCAACRELRAELEEEEKLVRAAVAVFGNREAPTGAVGDDLVGEGDVCPPEAQLAAFAEGMLEGNIAARLESHVASCGLCRASYVAVSAPVMVEVRDSALLAARARIAAARVAPSVSNKTESRRSNSHRKSGSRAVFAERSRLAERSAVKYTPITPMPSPARRDMGLFVAAAALVFVAIGLFAFHDTTDHTETSAQAPVAHTPASPAPVETVAPHGPARPLETHPSTPTESSVPDSGVASPTTPSDVVVAKGDGLKNDGLKTGDDEEDPASESDDDAPHGPRGVGPANSGRPTAPQTSPAGESRPAPIRSTPIAPTTNGRPSDPASTGVLADQGKSKPVTLACTVAGIQGSVELRKHDSKSWRPLTATDSVEVGDGVRAKGVDSGFTFVGRAHVLLDAEATGQVSYEGKGVSIVLESGSVEGEALARYGLKISDANGSITVWKGAKVRVESLPEGLRVCVDEGKVRVENSLGHCIVSEGHEAIVVATKAPHASSRGGPRRTVRR